MFASLDHYPLTWSLSFSPLDNTPSNFLFHKDKCADWVKAFKSELKSKWSLPLDDLDLPQFSSAVDIFMDAMIKTSMEVCLRKPHSPKAARWFDQDVKRALNIMRHN